MKTVKYSIIILLLTWTGYTFNAAAHDHELPHSCECKSSVAVIDSIWQYEWNDTVRKWIPQQVYIYHYYDSILPSEIIWQSLPSRDTLNRQFYEINENLVDRYTFQSWENQTWKNLTQVRIQYNSIGVRTFAAHYRWEPLWKPYQRFFYKSDSNNLIIYYRRQFRDNENRWYDFSEHFLIYNEDSQLVKRYEIAFEDGDTIWQNTYFYKSDGLLDYFIMKREVTDPVTGEEVFMNYSKTSYIYDMMNLVKWEITKTWNDGSWKNSTLKVFYREADRMHKVPVCHNGHTIYIDRHAVKAHLAHGDCLGKCLYEKVHPSMKEENSEGHNVKSPFYVYPNPAREMITIKFDKDLSNEIKRIDLIDFYGKTVRSFNVRNNSDFTIYRGDLMSGKYYVRMLGKEFFSQVVIFE